MPNKRAAVVDAITGADLTGTPGASALIDEVVAYYQTAAEELHQLDVHSL
jgi:hypothetical protein